MDRVRPCGRSALYLFKLVADATRDLHPQPPNPMYSVPAVEPNSRCRRGDAAPDGSPSEIKLQNDPTKSDGEQGPKPPESLCKDVLPVGSRAEFHSPAAATPLHTGLQLFKRSNEEWAERPGPLRTGDLRSPRPVVVHGLRTGSWIVLSVCRTEHHHPVSVRRFCACVPHFCFTTLRRNKRLDEMLGQSSGPIRVSGGRSGIEPGEPCTPLRQSSRLVDEVVVRGFLNSATAPKCR